LVVTSFGTCGATCHCVAEHEAFRHAAPIFAAQTTPCVSKQKKRTQKKKKKKKNSTHIRNGVQPCTNNGICIDEASLSNESFQSLAALGQRHQRLSNVPDCGQMLHGPDHHASPNALSDACACAHAESHALSDADAHTATFSDGTPLPQPPARCSS
jgi:hypothetical protein